MTRLQMWTIDAIVKKVWTQQNSEDKKPKKHIYISTERGSYDLTLQDCFDLSGIKVGTILDAQTGIGGIPDFTGDKYKEENVCTVSENLRYLTYRGSGFIVYADTSLIFFSTSNKPENS